MPRQGRSEIKHVLCTIELLIHYEYARCKTHDTEVSGGEDPVLKLFVAIDLKSLMTRCGSTS